MRKVIVLLYLLFMASYLEAISSYTLQDSIIYEKCISNLKENADLPIHDLLVKTALYFRGKPYVASTLDKNGDEKLVVNLREFDCTTFAESCVALARTLKSDDYSFQNYCRQLQLIRYRGGIVEDYASRLHYMTDWVYDNSRKGIFSDMSVDLGGEICEKNINFMSKHPESYPALKNNSFLQKKIQLVEDRINNRKSYSFIKKEDVKEVEDKIVNGDIVIFATSISGLDYSHIGIAYREKDKLTFIHASTRSKTVIVEPRSLDDYCRQSSRCTGVSIIRLYESKNG